MSEDHSATVAVMIREGLCDGGLDEVGSAINQRRTFLDSQASLKLAPGMRVRVVPSEARPHKTDGATGTVRRITKATVHVDVDPRCGVGTNWRFPASSLAPIGGER